MLFATGFLLAWAGVLHWMLLGLGVTQEYRSVFHAITQIQAVMMAFATGFLLTFIPRRTQTAPPPRLLVWVLAAALGSVALFAWLERWALTQAGWWLVVGSLIVFVARRRRAAGPGLPPSFVWVPVSLLAALGGSVLVALGGAMGWMRLHDVGRAALLQGMFTGLAIGLGSFLLPMLTRGAPAQDVPGPKLHALAAVLFFASFGLEPLGMPRVAFAARALIVLAVLLMGRVYRWPTQPGLHRTLAWIAVWMLPIGNALVALLPEYKRAALHVLFIGGFGLMVFSVSAHVVLAHEGRPQALSQSPWVVRVMGLLFGVALICRALLDVDAERFTLWIAIAAGAFLAATLAWVWLIVGRTWVREGLARARGAAGLDGGR